MNFLQARNFPIPYAMPDRITDAHKILIIDTPDDPRMDPRLPGLPIFFWTQYPCDSDMYFCLIGKYWCVISLDGLELLAETMLPV